MSPLYGSERSFDSQLSNIADSLYHAVQRRESDVRKRTSRETIQAPSTNSGLSSPTKPQEMPAIIVEGALIDMNDDIYGAWGGAVKTPGGSGQVDKSALSLMMDAGLHLDGRASPVNPGSNGGPAVSSKTSLTPSNDENDPKKMLAEIERNSRGRKLKSTVPDDDIYDLETLRAKIASIISSPLEPVVLHSPIVAAESSSQFGLERDPVNVSGRNKGPVDDKNGEREKKEYIARAEADLKRQIQETLYEENKHRALEAKKRQPCRVIVTNIATDAEEDDLAAIFDHLDFRQLQILEELNHTNRTRVAYVDFYDRKAAVEASELTEYLFGLKIHIRLAVDVSQG